MMKVQLILKNLIILVFLTSINYTIAQESTHILKCQFTDSNEKAIENATVKILVDGNYWSTASSNTDTEGKVEFELDGGEYYIQVIVKEAVIFESEIFVLNENSAYKYKLNNVLYLNVNIKPFAGNDISNYTIKVYDTNDDYYSFASEYIESTLNTQFILPSGNYYITIYKNDVELYQGEAFDLYSDNSIDISLPKTNSISFVVKDADGNLIENAKIYIFEEDSYWQLTSIYTDTKGFASIILPDNSYFYQIYENNIKYYESEAEMYTSDKEIGVQLPEDFTLKINITDSEGIGQESLYIYIYDEDDISISYDLTDEDGAILFTLPSNKYYVKVERDWTTIYEGELFDFTKDEIKTIALEKEFNLQCTVNNFDGGAANNVVVRVFEKGANEYDYLLSETTDEQGKVSFQLKEGDYFVKVRKDWITIFTGSDFNLSQDKDIAIQLKKSSPLTVNIGDETGKLMPDIEVTVFTENEQSYDTKYTDENGQTIFDLLDSSYYLAVYKNWEQIYKGELFVLNGEKTFNIEIATYHKCTFTVLDNDGKPVEDFDVSIYKEGETNSLEYNYTNKSGKVEMEIQKGNYFIRVFNESINLFQSDIFEINADLDKTITLPKLFNLKVNVVDANELKVEDAYVAIYVSDEFYTSKYTNTTGNVSFQMPQESYSIRISKDYKELYEGDYFVLDQDLEVGVKFLKLKELSYKISDFNGKEVDYAEVTLYDSSDDYYVDSKYTDESGLVKFSVEDGNYYIRVKYNGLNVFNGEKISFNESKRYEISLPQFFPVSITVLDSEGNPVSDAGIYLMQTKEEYSNTSAYTNKGGIGSFDLPSGQYSGTIYKDDIVICNIDEFEILAAKDIEIVTPELYSYNIFVVGQDVTNEDISISIFNNQDKEIAYTYSSGKEFVIPEGTYYVKVYLDYSVVYHGAPFTLSGDKDENIQISENLTYELSLSLLENGNVFPDIVQIDIYDENNTKIKTGETDENGYFYYQALEGTYYFTISNNNEIIYTNDNFALLRGRHFTVETGNEANSITKARKHELYVYPNPCYGSLKFSTYVNSICVYNLTGTMVLYKNNGLTGELDMRNLPSDLYIVKTKSNLEVKTFKVFLRK